MARSLAGFQGHANRRGRSFALANGSIRRLRGSAGCVPCTVDDRADSFGTLVPRQPQLIEPAAARVLCRRIGRPGRFAGAVPNGAKQAILGAGARKQRGNRGARRKAGSQGDQRSLFQGLAGPASRTADPVACAAIGFDGSLARRRASATCLRSAVLIEIAIVGHATVSVLLVVFRVFLGRLPDAPSAIFPARSFKGSRARNNAIAAITPVAATGRLRTASTAFSAMSAPFSLAPCQAFDAKVPGLMRACSRCAVSISRARVRSVSILAARTSGGSRVTGLSSSARRHTRRVRLQRLRTAGRLRSRPPAARSRWRAPSQRRLPKQ